MLTVGRECFHFDEMSDAITGETLLGDTESVGRARKDDIGRYAVFLDVYSELSIHGCYKKSECDGIHQINNALFQLCKEVLDNFPDLANEYDY